MYITVVREAFVKPYRNIEKVSLRRLPDTRSAPIPEAAALIEAVDWVREEV
jgi:hypothetical protein